MAKPEREMPAPSLSPSEMKFVLRNAKRKTGPEVLRDLARGEEDQPAPKPARKAARGPKTLF